MATGHHLGPVTHHLTGCQFARVTHVMWLSQLLWITLACSHCSLQGAISHLLRLWRGCHGRQVSPWPGHNPHSMVPPLAGHLCGKAITAAGCHLSSVTTCPAGSHLV